MADLTIKFKGQPIVEMTESGTKTLKTAGKYCEGDISVEYAKPAGGGGGGSGFAETICEVAVNNIVSSNWSPSCIVKDTTPPATLTGAKCYYNGVLLPGIPAEMFVKYPYAWIRKHTTNDQYQLILAAYPWYYNSGTVNCSGGNSVTEPWYNITISTAETATEWTFFKNITGNFSVDSARTVLWSNHDIPNGSATATEIYFEGSEPVLAE